MEPINFFIDVGYLDPKCNTCGAQVDYGMSTHFDDQLGCHVCDCCGEALRN